MHGMFVCHVNHFYTLPATLSHSSSACVTPVAPLCANRVDLLLGVGQDFAVCYGPPGIVAGALCISNGFVAPTRAGAIKASLCVRGRGDECREEAVR